MIPSQIPILMGAQSLWSPAALSSLVSLLPFTDGSGPAVKNTLAPTSNPTNYLLGGEGPYADVGFNATWTDSYADGPITGTKAGRCAAGGNWRYNATEIAAGTYTLTVYARATTTTCTLKLRMYNGSFTDSATFNLDTTWTQYSLTFTTGSKIQFFEFAIVGDMLLACCQLHTGSTVNAYTGNDGSLTTTQVNTAPTWGAIGLTSAANGVYGRFNTPLQSLQNMTIYHCAKTNSHAGGLVPRVFAGSNTDTSGAYFGTPGYSMTGAANTTLKSTAGDGNYHTFAWRLDPTYLTQWIDGFCSLVGASVSVSFPYTLYRPLVMGMGTTGNTGNTAQGTHAYSAVAGAAHDQSSLLAMMDYMETQVTARGATFPTYSKAVVGLGDSITNNTGSVIRLAAVDADFASTLAWQLNGISGSGTPDATRMTYCLQPIQKFGGGVVVSMFGVNSLGGGSAAIIAAHQAISAQVTAAGGRYVVQTILPQFPPYQSAPNTAATNAVNAAIRDGTIPSYSYIDYDTLGLTSGDFSDGLHPTTTCYSTKMYPLAKPTILAAL